MLAIARALIRNARLILLDEPFEGLAPIIVQDLLGITTALAQAGRTIVIVEQNVAVALSIAHRASVLNNGHLVWSGTARPWFITGTDLPDAWDHAAASFTRGASSSATAS